MTLPSFKQLLFVVLLFLVSCTSNDPQNPQKRTKQSESATKRAGFQPSSSDEKAIVIANDVIQAMGGEQTWENTAYIRWNFFGRRQLLWDKRNDRVKIQIPDQKTTINLDFSADTGNVYQQGEQITAKDSVQQFLQKGKQMWANDAYWLAMPFKLKDKGVQLSYLGEDTLKNKQLVDVLEVTFNEVGFTPQNKYHVFVGQDSNLVRKWAFYQKASHSEPSMVTPWKDYRRYGDLLLSSNRGRFQLSDIAVYDSVPDAVFAKAGGYQQ